MYILKIYSQSILNARMWFNLIYFFWIWGLVNCLLFFYNSRLLNMHVYETMAYININSMHTLYMHCTLQNVCRLAIIYNTGSSLFSSNLLIFFKFFKIM